MEPLWHGGTKVCLNGLGHMTKMAAMPICGKNLKKIFSGTKTPMIMKLDMQLMVQYCLYLCRGVYSFRLSIHPFVRWDVHSSVCAFVTFMEFMTKFFTELHASFSSGVYLTNHT